VTWHKDNSATERGTAVLALVLVVTLLAGFVGMSVADLDTTAYVAFCAGPAVSASVGMVLSRKVAAVAGDIVEVKHQTNGIASAAAAAVEAHLVLQDRAAVEVARDAAEHRERLNESPVGPPYVVPSDGP
jgi:hypothetical protein